MITQKNPHIYFWLPTEVWPDPFPDRAEDFVSRRGFDSWITQTYLRLREANFECYRADKIPEEGIIVVYRDYLPYDFRPNSRQLIVCVKADNNPKPYAQIHVVHNRSEAQYENLRIESIQYDQYLLIGPRYYIPHWPQPRLIPRDLDRGDAIKNIAYYGSPYNLAPELKSSEWEDFLSSLNLNWIVEKRRDYWHDYSQVDLVIAVRDFSDRSAYPWKPASKLFNSWRAGSPAILGVETGFQQERKSFLDYLEVDSYESLKASVKYLIENPKIYRDIRENGFQRAQEIEIDRIVECWQKFLLEVAIPEYDKWINKNILSRYFYFMIRSLAPRIISLKKSFIKVMITCGLKWKY